MIILASDGSRRDKLVDEPNHMNSAFDVLSWSRRDEHQSLTSTIVRLKDEIAALD